MANGRYFLVAVVLGLLYPACTDGSPTMLSTSVLPDQDKPKICHVSTTLKLTDGTFKPVNEIPWDVICNVYPAYCSIVDGKMKPMDPTVLHLKVSGKGWYGLQSIHKDDFGRLVVFQTKKNHSDPFEEVMNHGCEGTMRPDLIPDEPWIALIRRGNCKFSKKIRNAAEHNAKAVIVYTDTNPPVTMIHGVQDLVTVMISNTTGENIAILKSLLDAADGTMYTKDLYVNITLIKELECGNNEYTEQSHNHDTMTRRLNKPSKVPKEFGIKDMQKLKLNMDGSKHI